ncbi:helix-turn-helix transcriptional regulator [Niastella populi]|uniref:Transcriptional regulator n=1 Tax=Niastella populi TaxID=550983 RepID=A0A1V9FGV9_9BACT|nr:helix-turn-helix transcriptional regulator [Niastella populi]OQP57603.1 transcriptional regulator [Niastella populi]
MAKNEINRIRVVLAEKGITNKWLAEKLKKNPTTISRWCSNEMQPSLETLVKIAEKLAVDVKDLINSTTNKR